MQVHSCNKGSTGLDETPVQGRIAGAACCIDDRADRVLTRIAGGAGTSNALTGTILKVVEDTPAEWHVFVCTLCSCYPAAILGLPPHWYKVGPLELLDD